MICVFLFYNYQLKYLHRFSTGYGGPVCQYVLMSEKNSRLQIEYIVPYLPHYKMLLHITHPPFTVFSLQEHVYKVCRGSPPFFK